MNRNRILLATLWVLTAALVAGLIIWLKGQPAPHAPEIVSGGADQPVAVFSNDRMPATSKTAKVLEHEKIGRKKADIAADQGAPRDDSQGPDLPRGAAQTPDSPRADAPIPELVQDELVSETVLAQMLPRWMQQYAVDLHSERLKIADTWITRSRGRFHWEHDRDMEVEISDLGPAATENLLASLGFNPNLELSDTPSGFVTISDTENCLVNHEYDYEAQAGSLQMLVSGRFLVEITLGQLPLESFQNIVDLQLPIDELVRLAAELSAEKL